MSADGQGTKCRRKIAENYNRLSRVHEPSVTDKRRTGDSIFSLKRCSLCCFANKHIKRWKQ